jgi:hypothetical protein
MISAIYNFALTTGANRVIRGARIEHVCGDPTLSPEKDYAFGMRIVTTALQTLTIAVLGPTLFDPMASTNMGAPTWPPSPQTFGTPRQSRGAPL